MRALLLWSLGSVGLLGLLASGALYQGLIWFNDPSLAELPVQGLDVSHHQGEIDWRAVAGADRHRFVWIKATEGGDWVDSRFQENWRGAQDAGLVVGAYHFFTFCRPVADQLANYTATVPRAPGALPPALDLEFTGNCSRRPGRSELLADVETFMRGVEAHYGQRPLLYTTYPVVEAYLRGSLADYTIPI